MIDIESEVLNAVKNGLPEGVSFTPTFQPRPPHFPHVSGEEKSNSSYRATQDSGSVENHASVGYEFHIYSNKEGCKKAEARALCAVVDGIMQYFGFARTYCQPTPNLADATVYRITARYEAVVDTHHNIYRR